MAIQNHLNKRGIHLMSLQEMACYSMNECLRVQMDGTSSCETCDLANLDSCGGQRIRSTGRNQKGYIVTSNGLATQAGAANAAKKKKKKK